MPPGSTTLPLYFCNFGSKSQKFINVAKWTLCCLFVLPELPPFLLLTFAKFHAWIVKSFLHSWSTTAFTSGISIACGIGMNLCTKLWRVIEVNPLPAMWSWWFFWCWEDSTRCLVDSWDSTRQPYTDLEFFSDAIFGFAVTFVMLLGGLLHGVAGAIGLSNSSSGFLRISLCSSSFGSIK